MPIRALKAGGAQDSAGDRATSALALAGRRIEFTRLARPGFRRLLDGRAEHLRRLGNHRMAKVLKEKGYEYQYLFCLGQGHGIGNAQQQFLPHAIEWVWRGHAPKVGSSE